MFVVTIGSEDDTETYMIDKTYQEIVNAINGGSFVVCRQAFEGYGHYFSSNVSYSAEDNTVTFDFLYATIGTQQCSGQIKDLSLEEFLIDENDNLTYQYAKNTICGGVQ